MTSLGFKKLLNYIGKFVTTEDILILFLYGAAARGVLRINATDVVWLGRKLLFRWLKVVYVTVIFTYFIVQRTIPRAIESAWSAAKNKARLARRTKGRVKSWEIGARLFLQKLLLAFEEMARQAYSLVYERGLTLIEAQNPLPMRLNNSEDICALMILVMLVAACIPIAIIIT